MSRYDRPVIPESSMSMYLQTLMPVVIFGGTGTLLQPSTTRRPKQRSWERKVRMLWMPMRSSWNLFGSDHWAGNVSPFWWAYPILSSHAVGGQWLQMIAIDVGAQLFLSCFSLELLKLSDWLKLIIVFHHLAGSSGTPPNFEIFWNHSILSRIVNVEAWKICWANFGDTSYKKVPGHAVFPLWSKVALFWEHTAYVPAQKPPHHGLRIAW